MLRYPRFIDFFKDKYQEFIDDKFRYLDDTFTYFVKNAQLNIYGSLNYRNFSFNLMNYLPLLKGGFSTPDGLCYLLKIYSIINNLITQNDSDYLVLDSLMLNSFNGDIPATFLKYETKFSSHNIIMIDALKDGSIIKSLNTIEVLKSALKRDIGFNLILENNKIHTNLFQYIVDYNTYCSKYLTNTVEQSLINNKEFIGNMINEENLLGALFCVIKKLSYNKTANITIYELILTSIMIDSETTIKQWTSDPWTYLLYAVIKQNSALVRDKLPHTDARINNHEAYHVALKVNNPPITKIIRDSIIKRNLIEKQVLIQSIEPLIGSSDIPKTIFNYMFQFL